jgi:hypothetical protein
MKKYTYFLLSAFILIIASCSEKFLDEEQVGVLKYDYYESEEGIEKLINSCYGVLRKKYGDEWTYALWNYGTDEWKRGDHSYTTHAMGGYNDYTEMISPVGFEVGYKQYPENIWAAYFNGIDRCNLAIEKIPMVQGGVGIMKDQDGKNIRTAEVRFLRAMFLFLLVQQWGPIPYHLVPSSGSETEWPRRPVSEVYDDIIRDLEFAYQYCPEKQSEYGRVTKNAARHYLAKVLLTRASGTDTDPFFGRGGNKEEDLTLAAAMAEECINSGYNSLLPNFADVWKEGNEINSEIVFATQFNQDVNLLGGNSNDYRNNTHVYWLNQYDTEVGMARNIEYGRPFRRMHITDYTCDIFDRLNDSRLRKSLLEVFYSTKTDMPTETSYKWTAQELLFAFTNIASDTSWAIRYGDTIRVGDPKFKLATANPSNPEYVNVGDTALVFLLNDKNTTLTDREIIGRGYTIYARYYWITDPVTRAPIKLMNRDTIFTEEDDRKGIHIRAWVPGKAPSLLKFRDRHKSDVASYQGTRDFFDARLAETYLIAAEAYGRLGNYSKAVEFINAVRRRAAYHAGETRPNLWWQFDGGTQGDLSGREDAMMITESYWDNDVPLEHYTSPSLTREQRFIEFMLNERCRELMGEMMRWEDLVRTETLYQRAMMFNDDTRAAGTMREYHKLRPIPQSHIDAITVNGRPLNAQEKQAYQNPGY